MLFKARVPVIGAKAKRANAEVDVVKFQAEARTITVEFDDEDAPQSEVEFPEKMLRDATTSDAAWDDMGLRLHATTWL